MQNAIASLFIWIILIGAFCIISYKFLKRFCPRLLVFEEVNEEEVNEEEEPNHHNIIVEEIQMENIAGEVFYH
jgi:hypothetical protein|tara:strand:+ start:1453 stop:1671 length:219 start_codon:yes stop_codon:yes gene_type:complete